MQRRARSQNVIQTENEVTGLQYHPLIENIFVSSDGAGRVCLRDARMAFGPLTKRSNEGIVQVVSMLNTEFAPDRTFIVDSTTRS